jgi:hypothetical protein
VQRLVAVRELPSAGAAAPVRHLLQAAP